MARFTRVPATRRSMLQCGAMTTRYDFTSHLTRFCRLLRAAGLLVGPREASEAIRALGLVDVLDRGRVYWALRTVLISRREDIAPFDEMFERLWSFEPQPGRPATKPGMSQAGGMREFRRRPRAFLPEPDDASDETAIQLLRTGASSRHVVSRQDLTVLDADGMAEVSRIAARMVRVLASRPGRRRKRHRRKGTPDLRGALRLNLTVGGDPLRLPRMRRVPRVPRLLVLLDVSGSMDRHARLLLQLIYAVAQHTKRVETFAFSTALTRVPRALSAPSFTEALSRIGKSVDHWSGGTRIGESIARVNTEWEHLLHRDATVFLASDGWDTGEPAELARELARMRRRTRSLVWLNPLLGTADYEPRTRGLQAALPHVDHLTSARDLGQLKRLPQLLRA